MILRTIHMVNSISDSAVWTFIFCYVQILSIQPVSNADGTSSGSRQRRSADSQQLDVLLAVQKTDTRYFRSNALKRRIDSVSSAVEQQSGVHIVRVFNSVCNRDSCAGDGVSGVSMDCVTVVSLDSSAPMTVVADRESFISPQHQLTVKCVCRSGTSLTLLAHLSYNMECLLGYVIAEKISFVVRVI